MIWLQRKHLNIVSMGVVSLVEVAIFAEGSVFFGFLQFSKAIRKMDRNMIYQSIAADQGYLQVTLLCHLAYPIGRYMHFQVLR